MFKQLIKSIIYSVVILNLCACTNSDQKERHENLKKWFTADGRIKVLSTTAMIDDIVAQVGGEYVDRQILINPELDPHSYQLVKGDDEKLAYAEMIFCNGLGLEHGPSLRKSLAENSKAIAVGDKIKEANPDLILKYNGQTDPHIWMDISMWERIVPTIVAALSEKKPENAAYFAANGEKLSQKMKEEHLEIKKIMQGIDEKKRYLVTSHDAFSYFTRAYLSTPREIQADNWQQRFAAPEGLAPDSQLSSTDIQYIINHLAKHQIQVIFPECNLSRDSINKILQAGNGKGLTVRAADVCLYSDSMGPKGSGADTYLKMVRYNAEQIAMNLEEKDGKSR